jgi:hypothetical protein
MIKGIESEIRKDIREKKKSLPRGGVAKKKPRSIITPYDLNPNRYEMSNILAEKIQKKDR